MSLEKILEESELTDEFSIKLLFEDYFSRLERAFPNDPDISKYIKEKSISFKQLFRKKTGALKRAEDLFNKE